MTKVVGATLAGHAERLFHCAMADDGTLEIWVGDQNGNYRQEMRVDPAEFVQAVLRECVKSQPVQLS